MRHIGAFLGAILFATPAFAFNDSVVMYCAITPQPQHCIFSFLTFEQYYAVEYGKFLAAVETFPIPPVDELVSTFCATPVSGTPEHCQSTLTTQMPYARDFMRWHDQLDRRRELQQRQIIDAQLEQARTQANDKALFGAGNALINGMNQGLQNMQLPYNQPPGRR